MDSKMSDCPTMPKIDDDVEYDEDDQTSVTNKKKCISTTTL
jgi:hypothetical protein